MTNDFVIPDRRGLVAEYLLNGDTRDSSGNGYNGTPLNVTYSKTDSGYQTYGGNFNGSSSKVDTGFGWLNNNFSVSMVLTKWDSDWVAFSMRNSWCRIHSSWTVAAHFFDWADRYISSSPWYVTDSKPHHLVWVKTSTNWQALWLDWVKVAENTSHNWTLSTYTWSPWIGYFRTFNANYTSGSIQSVRIFNRALSETEIRNWYLESKRALGGSSLAWLTDGLVAQINTTEGNKLSDIVWGVAVTKTSGTATTDNLGYVRAITNPNYTWTSITYTTWYVFENAGSGWVLTQSPSGLSATGINRTTTLREIFLFKRTLSTDEKNALETLCKLDYVLPFDGATRYGLPPQLKEGCVLFIPWEVSGTTVYDASGNSNHWTLVNSPTKTRGGLWGYEGLKFNGSNQYVRKDSNVMPSTITAPYSMGCTVTFHSSPSSGSVFDLVMGQYTNGSTWGSRIIRYHNNGWTLRIGSVVWGNAYSQAYGNFTFVIGVPYRLMATYDWTVNRIHVNGVEVGSNSAVPTEVINQLNRFSIGAYLWYGYDSWVNFANATVTNPYVNTSALSADKIRLDASTFFIP